MTGPRLYQSRIHRVPTYSSVIAHMDLGFGVFVQKEITVEGVTSTMVKDQWKEATHCLVVLCGGKDVLLYVDGSEKRYVGRIYVPEWVPASPAIPLSTPPGFKDGMVEVGSWMSWARDHGFDAKILRAALKG